MLYFGDYHTHSHYSDGRQEIEDIVEAAIGKGLREIAITDHGPRAAVIGVKKPASYLDMRVLIEELNQANREIQILLGAEANITDINGTLDIPAEIIKDLDILIAGLHPYTRPASVHDGLNIWLRNSLRHLGKRQREKAMLANTKACVETVYRNPYLDILSHPGLFFSVDITEVSRACARNDVLFEINCGHRYPVLSDIIEAERTGVDFIVNSDAHFKDMVGELQYGSEVMESLSLEPKRVVNFSSNGGHCKWTKAKRICTY